MKITDVEEAVKYLAETDTVHAELTANLESMKDGEKHLKGQYVMGSDLPTSKAEHKFYSSKDFTEVMKLRKDGFKALKELTNKRSTAVYKIEIWRTLEASRRKGNIQ